jgi:hypothetical protein
MGFVANTILATLAAALLLAVGLGHYDAAHFEAAMHPLSESYDLAWRDIKTARARAIVGPKLVIVSGPTGLFGLRCSVFSGELGAACVNGALPGPPPIDGLLAFDRTLMRPGDVALVQLDPATYVAPRQSPPVVPPTRLFRIDLKYLLSAVAERLLAATGYSFFGQVVATPEGDQRGHTRARAALFADARADAVTADAAVARVARDQLAAFQAWAKDNRILVVGTPAPTDRPVPDGLMAAIGQVFTGAGSPFLVLPNGSRYPRDCFLDSGTRLNEECQMLHSRDIAGALAPILAQRGYALR